MRVDSSQRRLAELEALYRERLAAFARVAISITGSVDIGKDAVQESFARAIEQRDRFRGDCALETWVWRIVVNTAKTEAERGGREASEGAAVPEDSSANGRRLLSDVDRWMRTLPERQRLAVFLRYWADLDYRGIAEVLEVEVGTVSATLSKAHQSLRRSLQEVQR
jgi:RNA polymerase sigma-70 factor (ECF subfamily)